MYSKVCVISENPEVWFVKNATAQRFHSRPEDANYDPLTRNDTYLARRCDCSPSGSSFAYYCPDPADICYVTAFRSDFVGAEVLCIEEQPSYHQFLFAFSIFALCFVLILCLRSADGHVLLRYWRRVLLRLCCSRERYEQSIQLDLRRVERDLAFRQILGHGVPVGNISDPFAARAPAVIVTTARKGLLKTKFYDKRSNNNNNHVEETCPICLLEIEDGARIGDLKCGHVYHIDCLKGWLQRKNSCPLCKVEDIASIHSMPTVAGIEGSGRRQSPSLYSVMFSSSVGETSAPS